VHKAPMDPLNPQEPLRMSLDHPNLVDTLDLQAHRALLALPRSSPVRPDYLAHPDYHQLFLAQGRTMAQKETREIRAIPVLKELLRRLLALLDPLDPPVHKAPLVLLDLNVTLAIGVSHDPLELMACKVLRALPGKLDQKVIKAIPVHKDMLDPLVQPDPPEPG